MQHIETIASPMMFFSEQTTQLLLTPWTSAASWTQSNQTSAHETSELSFTDSKYFHIDSRVLHSYSYITSDYIRIVLY